MTYIDIDANIKPWTDIANKYDVLSREAEDALLRRYKSTPPDTRAKDILMKHNYRMAINIAKKYRGRGLPFPDLIQEALIGLSTGIDKFNPDSGNKLSTYATWWIRQAVARAVDNTSRLVRTPIHRLNELRTVQRLYGQYIERWGEAPSSDELVILVKKASELDPKCKVKDLTKEDIELLGRMLHKHNSLDESNTDDGNLTMKDYLSADEDKQPEVIAEALANKSYVEYLMQFLSPDEKMFISSKFGLIDGKFRDKKEFASFTRMTEDQSQDKLKSIFAKLTILANRNKINLGD